MGIISGSVLQHGGAVTAVVPGAMLRAGGEGEGTRGSMSPIELKEKGREKVMYISPDPFHSLRPSQFRVIHAMTE